MKIKSIIVAFIILLLFELIGNLAQSSFGIPVPGPLIGMFLFATFLYFRPRLASTGIQKTSRLFTAHMGLFFVPAGVGVVAQIQRLRREWFPVTVALLLSTLLSLVVSAFIMQWICRARAKPETATRPGERE